MSFKEALTVLLWSSGVTATLAMSAFGILSAQDGKLNAFALVPLVWSVALGAGPLSDTVREAFGCLDGHVRNCGQPWSVLSVDPETMAVVMIVQGDGHDFGAASSAAFAQETLVVGTWAGDRALRLPAR